MSKLLKLTPCAVSTVWGGNRLNELKNLMSEGPIGETWEVSTHAKGMSLVGDKPLIEFCHLNYMVKLIDTTAHLSVQVHPDDEYAKKNENELGKNECWLVLAAKEGAGIYLGFRAGVTKKEFKNAIENKLSLEPFLNFIEVKPGDFFAVPAGIVHAIGEGVFLAESQQSSGVTYRVWDWNRMGLDGKPRELHVEKSLDVLKFQESFNAEVLSMQKKNLFAGDAGVLDLYTHDDFKVKLVSLKESDVIDVTQFSSIVVVEGDVEIDGESLKQYDSAVFSIADELQTSGKARLLMTMP